MVVNFNHVGFRVFGAGTVSDDNAFGDDVLLLAGRFDIVFGATTYEQIETACAGLVSALGGREIWLEFVLQFPGDYNDASHAARYKPDAGLHLSTHGGELITGQDAAQRLSDFALQSRSQYKMVTSR
jgi:hypothetical protein